MRRPSRREVVLAAPAAVLAAACGRVAPPEEGRAGETRPSPPEARAVTRVVEAQATSDGAGVKLRRSLGSRALAMLDPFLMLDEFHTDRAEDYLAGFPNHPHRGFETVTYMIDGAMEHQDSLGNRGRLGPGSVQWMTAGRGIIHSEMPKQERGLMWGFQLWVNLPSNLKMTKPRYQDLQAGRIPEIVAGDAKVRIVAGEVLGTRGAVDAIVTSPTMLDVTLAKSGRFEHALPRGHAAFAYVFDGAVRLGEARVARGQLAVLGAGDLVSATSDGGGRFLLLAAQPIGEPVARYGPFVMNTEDELRRAFEDYRSGRLVQQG